MSVDKKIVIVKLGGAAITNKKETCQFAPTLEFEKIMDQIQFVYNQLKDSGHQLILVHGAGSFGHPQAKKYQLKKGWSDLALKGLSHIRQSLQLLNYTIVSSLEKRDVPVMAMSPIDYIVTDDCEKTNSSCFERMIERISTYLDLGFVPVLYGDAVLDKVRGCTILSGDVIMYQLAKLIPLVKRCVFLTDVEGIYKHDPKVYKGPENELIHEVKVDDTEHDAILDDNNHLTVADVTGGMQGKINWAKKIVFIQKEQPNRYIDTVICKYGTRESTQILSLQENQIEKLNMTVFRLN